MSPRTKRAQRFKTTPAAQARLDEAVEIRGRAVQLPDPAERDRLVADAVKIEEELRADGWRLYAYGTLLERRAD